MKKYSSSKKSQPKERLHQLRGLQTREKLLNVTAKSLAEEGLQGLRYAHIAKRANLPQALMGYHFPNIEILLLEVIQLELEKLKSRSVLMVDKMASQPKKALAAYIRAPFELAEEDALFRGVWSAFYHLATIHSKFRELNTEIRKTGRERILNLITMVLATEGRLMGEKTVTRERLLELALAVQGIVGGLATMVVSETDANFQEFSDLAVASAFKILGLD